MIIIIAQYGRQHFILLFFIGLSAFSSSSWMSLINRVFSENIKLSQKRTFHLTWKSSLKRRCGFFSTRQLLEFLLRLPLFIWGNLLPCTHSGQQRRFPNWCLIFSSWELCTSLDFSTHTGLCTIDCCTNASTKFTMNGRHQWQRWQSTLIGLVCDLFSTTLSRFLSLCFYFQNTSSAI